MRRDTLTKAAIVVGAVVATLVLLPLLEEIVVAGALFLTAGAFLVFFALAVLWHVARRHPLADVLIAAWLLHRHERRVRRVIDAQSWSARGTHPSSWPPPDPRTRSPW